MCSPELACYKAGCRWPVCNMLRQGWNDEWADGDFDQTLEIPNQESQVSMLHFSFVARTPPSTILACTLAPSALHLLCLPEAVHEWVEENDPETWDGESASAAHDWVEDNEGESAVVQEQGASTVYIYTPRNLPCFCT